jgi:enoyl-CoA hydratase/carnithine racemase
MDDPSAQVLRVSTNDGYRELTFDRPGALNAFNQDLWYAAAQALDDAAEDDEVRCVLLTGSGRAFSAGQDLGEMSNPAAFADRPPGYQRFMPSLEMFPKPIVAAVNGVAVGIGTTMLLHCDLVYMARSARLKVPFISLGVTTEASASLLLPERVGWQRAAEILFTEPWITADEAVTDGLARAVVDDDDLLAVARSTAAGIGALPLGPVVATKRLLLAGRAEAVAAARLRELAEFETLVGGMLADD